MHNTDPQPQRNVLLGIHAVMAVTDLSKASIYRLMKDGRFPRATPLIPGGRRVAWRHAEVMAWAAEPMAWGEEANF